MSPTASEPLGRVEWDSSVAAGSGTSFSLSVLLRTAPAHGECTHCIQNSHSLWSVL